jgi:small conductance mechanosensitive channel
MEKEIQQLQSIYNMIVEYLIKYGFQVLAGIIILVLGFKLASWTSRLVTNLCHKRNLDVTLTGFVAGVVKVIVIMFAALLALDKFGVTISPFIATVSAMIFGASFAIQAPLSNYAAGLSIIISRPFVVGNNVTIKGFNGVVEQVKLPCTILSTVDGEKITIPNKDIVGEIIVNSVVNKMVEITIGISYGDNPETAIELIRRTMDRFPQIQAQPAPQVGIVAFGDSSINIGMRYWVPTKEYYQSLHAVNLAVYQEIKKAGITLPFPQREVRILSK